MALHEATGRKTTFLVIKHHAICMESLVPQEGYEQLEVNNPKTNKMVTKYVKKFDGVDGYVVKVEWKDYTDQKTGDRYLGFVIHMRDGVEEFRIDLPLNSVPYRAFVKFAENLDFTKRVYFSAWHDKKRDSNAFGAMQDGKWIKHAFTIENPNGMPKPEDDGMGKLDFRDQARWLKRRIESVVMPRVDAAEAERQAEAVKLAKEPQVKHVMTSTTEGAPDKRTPAAADDPYDDELFNTVPSDDDIPF